MALGDYTLAKKAGLQTSIPANARKYLTVYYTCDSMISSGTDLLSRLCNDQDGEDGLLRLVPDDGKELTEFTRSKEIFGGADLKLVNWGAKGIESSKYARVVPDGIVQTFRNFVNAIITHQVKKRMRYDGLLIILDEFDVIRDKSGLGSLIKSLSSPELKFAICGVGRDLNDLVADHASVERLLEEGSINVQPMPDAESEEIIHTAERLFAGALRFDSGVVSAIATTSQGYPYFTQLIGKECVAQANKLNKSLVSRDDYDSVLDDIRSGRAFPTLESAYRLAIGNSTGRQLLLHLLAEQKEDQQLDLDEHSSRVYLKSTRKDAESFDIEHIDQLLPRLVDEKYGPVLSRVKDAHGVYEFINPVLRIYISVRSLPPS